MIYILFQIYETGIICSWNRKGYMYASNLLELEIPINYLETHNHIKMYIDNDLYTMPLTISSIYDIHLL